MVMPLIKWQDIRDCLAGRWNIPREEMPDSKALRPKLAEYVAEAQRDADLLVLETEMKWMENAWRDYAEAQKKEWARNEADFLHSILELPFFEFVLQVKEREQKLREKQEGKNVSD